MIEPKADELSYTEESEASEEEVKSDTTASPGISAVGDSLDSDRRNYPTVEPYSRVDENEETPPQPVLKKREWI